MNGNQSGTGEVASQENCRQKVYSAASPTGTLVVQTTEQGLPTAVRIDSSEMRRAPAELADRIVRLCRQSASAAGYSRRRQLAESGVPDDVLDAMRLPTATTAADAELDDDGDDDGPLTWMRAL